MSRYVVSPAAERDIESILVWTHEQFGASGRLRYGKLADSLNGPIELEAAGFEISD
jgi:plasmid stabilization system protein ParE